MIKTLKFVPTKIVSEEENSANNFAKNVHDSIQNDETDIVPRKNINGFGEKGKDHPDLIENIDYYGDNKDVGRCTVTIKRLTYEGPKYFQCFNFSSNNDSQFSELCDIHQYKIEDNIEYRYENDEVQKQKEDEYYRVNTEIQIPPLKKLHEINPTFDTQLPEVDVSSIQITKLKRATKTKKKTSKNNNKKFIKKQCERILTRGVNKGTRCTNKVVDDTVNEIGKGEGRFCKGCLEKVEVIALLSKEQKDGKIEIVPEIKISPTMPKMANDMKRAGDLPDFLLPLKNKEEFLTKDLYTLYHSKEEKKIFNDSIHSDFKSLSDHWKYIIEVIGCKEHVEYIPRILLWISDGKMKRMKDKTLWIKKETWMETDQSMMVIEANILKMEIVDRCLYILSDIKKNSTDLNNKLLDENILNIISRLKIFKSSKLSSLVIKSFISLLLDLKFSPQENPIGWDFINNMIEFTGDETKGITTTELYEAREEWLTKNPDSELQSYNISQLNSFGRMIKKYKTWEMTKARSNLTLHVGIKIRKMVEI